MKKSIAIIGANGQLGSDLVRVLSEDSHFIVYPLTHKEIEISSYPSITSAFDSIHPDIIINTAAYTKVDDAEMYPEKAYLINTIGTKNLAEYCKKNNSIFMFISSDYVYGLDRKRKIPLSEEVPPGPVSTYGISKLAGEMYVQCLLEKYFIVRTCGLFGVAGSSGKGYNFIELMLRLAKENKEIKVVNDQIMTPTYTLELAQQIATLLKTDNYGLYHITAEGECSWYEFAQEIFRLTRLHYPVTPVSSSNFPTRAERPKYSVLENKKLKGLEINEMSHWKKGLLNYLKEKGLAV